MPKAARRPRDPAGERKTRLRLYVSGMTDRSSRTIASVRRVCEKHLRHAYELEVIDAYQQVDAARRDRIVVLPTLIRLRPLPSRRVAGELSEGRILQALDLACRTDEP